MKPSLILGGAALFAAGILGALYSQRSVAAAQTAAMPTAAVPQAPSAAPAAPSPSPKPEPSAVAVSPETAQLEQRRVLYETVDALLQASEFERARKLLDEDQERNGDDLAPEWRDLEQGYRLIADCIEQPSPKHRARGEAFLLVNEAVALGPKLRAACVGKKP